MQDVNSGVEWRVSPYARATYSPDGCVLLDIKKGLCYSLNAVAARMWLTMEASQTGITLEGIVGALETHFNAPRQELETDTAEYLDKLEQMGLVQCNGHGRPFKAFGAGG
jgi:hypothetical protein